MWLTLYLFVDFMLSSIFLCFVSDFYEDLSGIVGKHVGEDGRGPEISRESRVDGCFNGKVCSF